MEAATARCLSLVESLQPFDHALPVRDCEARHFDAHGGRGCRAIVESALRAELDEGCCLVLVDPKDKFVVHVVDWRCLFPNLLAYTKQSWLCECLLLDLNTLRQISVLIFSLRCDHVRVGMVPEQGILVDGVAEFSWNLEEVTSFVVLSQSTSALESLVSLESLACALARLLDDL